MKLAIIQKAAPMIDKAKVVLNKRSPEIWLAAGIVAIVGGTVWACAASRQLDDILDDRDDKVEYLDELRDMNEKYIQEQKELDEEMGPEEDETKEAPGVTLAEYKKQRAIATIQCAGELVKIYIPAVILIGGGIGMVVNGHHILNKRNAALLSAYMTLDDSFTKYRSRVTDRYGEEVEHELYSGQTTSTVTVTELDENGKNRKVKQQVTSEPDPVSPYACFFEKTTSREWNTSPTYNHTWLLCQQSAANDLLRVRASEMAKYDKPGWIFLNEVLDLLGMKPTPTGAICGWLRYEDGRPAGGDGVVNFGMVEGNEDGSIFLDFNCQGMIYDKIGV